ncbi:hypothetical protein DVH24_028270 [Malus domestica]|uniref:Uncharacterized protein n=1 Tax=Malus domestica TaxID=3750 RepID=A0A498HGD6_MALDO|nr:hypothetical protein DVH24_028270 [Malus domestica]
MPCAVSAYAGNEHLIPYAVLAHAGEDFEPLEHLLPYAILARAGEDFKPLEQNAASCHLRLDTASCHLRFSFGFVPFETWGVPSTSAPNSVMEFPDSTKRGHVAMGDHPEEIHGTNSRDKGRLGLLIFLLAWMSMVGRMDLLVREVTTWLLLVAEAMVSLLLLAEKTANIFNGGEEE